MPIIAQIPLKQKMCPTGRPHEGGATMKLGIITVSVDVAALAQRAEELGFDSFWIAEHTATPVHIAPKTTTYRLHLEPDGTPQPLYRSGQFADPFITLARASAMTQTIKLGTGVCLVPEHHPLLLAKQVATLDTFSGGRFLFGIGAGWLNEETAIMGGRLCAALGPDSGSDPRDEGPVE